MKIRDLFEGKNDDDHFDALHRTGFFGAQGAGCVFLARDTGRIMIALRSAHVEQPHTWGGFGGAIDRGEDPVEAVKREIHEETGFTGEVHLEPLFVFKKDTFRYSNFLAIVDKEFTPHLDWENDGFKWVEFGQFPKPLHFGLVSLFNDPESVAKIQKAIQESKAKS